MSCDNSWGFEEPMTWILECCVNSWKTIAFFIPNAWFLQLKALDTFDYFQIPVFLQYLTMYININKSVKMLAHFASKLQEHNEKHEACWSILIFVWEISPFSKAIFLQSKDLAIFASEGAVFKNVLNDQQFSIARYQVIFVINDLF